jgi:hypothetical protein
MEVYMKQSLHSNKLRNLFYLTGLTLPACFVSIVVLASTFTAAASGPSRSSKGDWPIEGMSNFRIATTYTRIQDSRDYKRIAKELVDNLVTEDYDAVRENFNEQMRQGLSAERIAQTWSAVVQQLGSYQRQGTPMLIKDQGYDAVVIRCQMERGAVTVEVVYDNQGKVGGLWVRPAQ